MIIDLKFRFDYEIEIPVPNELQRKDILTKLLSNIQQDINEEEIVSIAYRAQGYVGSDLLAVVNRALTEAAINNENVTYKHMCTTVSQVKPSAIKEVMVQVPNVSFLLKSSYKYCCISFELFNYFIGQMDRYWWPRRHKIKT